MKTHEAKYLPTPAEIIDGCHRIQQRWSADDFRRRAGEEPKPERVNDSLWEPPTITTSPEMAAALEAM